MKIPDAKAAVDKEWKKLETIPAWQLEKVKSKMEVFLEAHRDKKKAHFATLMDICHLKNAELEPKFQKYKGQSRAPWWHCKRRLWSLCSFYWIGLGCAPNDCRNSNGCCCKTTRLRWTSSWRRSSIHSGGNWRTHPDGSEFQSQNVQTYGYVFHDTSGRNHGKLVWHPLAGFFLVGETFLQKLFWNLDGKSTELGMSFCSSKTRIILIGIRGWPQNGWKEADMGKNLKHKQ